MSANVVSVHLVAHYQRLLDKCNTSLGINFQIGINNINLICLYKSQEIFTVLPIDCA